MGDDIEATGDWNGLKITIRLIVQKRQAQISESSAAALKIRALNEPPRDHKRHILNTMATLLYTIENVIGIASQDQETTIHLAQ